MQIKYLFLKSMTMKCTTMHIVDYSLQMTVNVAVQNCALFYLCVVLWKKSDLLSKDTHVYSLLSRSRCQGPAYRWSNDLRSYDLCTTLIRLLHYSFLSCLPEINKYSEVSVKLESERSWKPTSCASSQLQRVSLFFFFLLQHGILWIWAPTVSLKLRF